MKGLKNVDTNKYSLRAYSKQQAGGEPAAKGQLVGANRPAPRKAAVPLGSKENAATLRLTKSKNNSKPAPQAKQLPTGTGAQVAATATPTATVSETVVSPQGAMTRPSLVPTESLMKKYSEVGDVDQQSVDNKDCLLVSGYVKDIFNYLRQLEISAAAVRPDFLQCPARLEITPRMRGILVNWLAQVHQRFSLLPETLYLTYHIVDAYMSSEAGPSVVKGQFQLIGVASMLLASKFEEVYPPNVGDFVYVTDNAYTASDVRQMECRILAQLGYFLGYPLPIQFLRRYSKVAGAAPAVHEAAKYLSELARADYAAAHLPPSALAAAAFCLARELLPAGNGGGVWTAGLEVFSGYSRDQLAPLLRLVAGIAVRAGESNKCSAIRKKYSSNAMSMVSMWPELSSSSTQLRSAAGIITA